MKKLICFFFLCFIAHIASAQIPHNIGDVNTVNSSGVGDSIGSIVRVSGLVSSTNFNSKGLQFALYDKTGDITVYCTKSLGYVVTIGDSISVDGKITQFNGLLELTATAVNFLSSGNTIKSPLVATKMADSVESKLLIFKGFKLRNPSKWKPGSGPFNIVAENAAKDSISLRIVPSTTAFNMSVPFGVFDITGIVGQFDPFSPYLSGYEFYPRDSNDFLFITKPTTIKGLPLYKISQVKPYNATTGVADSATAKTKAFLKGLAYSQTFRPGGLEFDIKDATGGIFIFASKMLNSYVPVCGDSVLVRGTVTQFNGLTEFTADSISLLNNGNALDTARIVTILDETTESDFIRLNGFSVADPTEWDTTKTANKAGMNIHITNGTDTMLMRVDRDESLYKSTVLKGTFDVRGIGSQFDLSNPYLQFYQVLPRDSFDIIRKKTFAPEISFTSAKLSGLENVDSIKVSVSITNQNTSPTSFSVKVLPASTATSTSDYTYSGKTYTFPASSSANISFYVKITNDKIKEFSETVVLGIYNRTNSATTKDSVVEITILDDDKAIPLYNISQLKPINSTSGLADSAVAKTRCFIKGLVYSETFRPGGLEFDLKDATAGIIVFATNTINAYLPARGDSILVRGTVTQYNGLTEFAPDSISVLNKSNTLKSSTIVTVLNETTEADFIRINGMMIADPTEWDTTKAANKSGMNIHITNGTDTFLIRVDRDESLYKSRVLKGTFDVQGIGTQFDATSPYFQNYQLLPRDSFDIFPKTTATVPQISFTTTKFSVQENIDSAMVSVSITNPNANPTSFSVKVLPASTASSISDYTYASKTYTFPASSNTSISFYVKITNDKIVESSETVVLGIYNRTNGATVKDSVVEITILDDDKTIPLYNISQLKPINSSSGVSDSALAKTYCFIKGLVYNESFRPGGLEFAVKDATAGITVFATKTVNAYTPKRGDSLLVRGAVTQYNGLIQFAPDSILLLNKSNTLKSSTLVTALNESTESDFVRINGMMLADPTEWDTTKAANKSVMNIHITNGKDTFVMRVDRDVSLYKSRVLKGNFDVQGIGTQFDATSPYFQNYQLLPRDSFDIFPKATKTAPEISFTTTKFSVLENVDSTKISVSITNPDANPTSFSIKVNGATTASFLTDYTYSGGKYTFPGSSSATINFYVKITNDKITEPSEKIVLEIYSRTNGATVKDSILELTILDDDFSSSLPVYTIAQIKPFNSVTGVNDSAVAKTRAFIHGVVYSETFRPGGLEFSLKDATGDITVFASKTLNAYVPKRGDSLLVRGTVTQYNGLTEFTTDSISVLLNGVALTPASIVTKLDETAESRLVKLNSLSIINPTQWDTTLSTSKAGMNIQVTNGTDTFIMRVDHDINLYKQKAPTGKFNLTGIGTQFDNSSPYLSGYQLMPRDTADIEILTSVGNPTVLFPEISVYPNPAIDIINIISTLPLTNLNIYDITGKLVIATKPENMNTNLNISTLQPGIYIIKALSEKGISSIKFRKL